MSQNTQKEDFSYAYVYAVTATAGYSLQTATRPIHTELVDRDYILALKAYQERLPIYCTGDLQPFSGKYTTLCGHSSAVPLR